MPLMEGLVASVSFMIEPLPKVFSICPSVLASRTSDSFLGPASDFLVRSLPWSLAAAWSLAAM